MSTMLLKQSHHIILLSILFSLSLIFPGITQAATYYVDSGSIGGICNDANTGQSLTQPWCSIQKAADTAVAGDTVNVRGGIYRESITPAHSGSSDSPIIYQNYEDETPVINGADSPQTWTSLGNEETGGLFVNGFEIGNFSAYNSTSADASNTVVAENSVVNHGLYSMKATYAGSDADARANRNYALSDDIYARMYFRISSDFDLNSVDTRSTILALRESTTTTRATVHLLKNGSGQWYVTARVLTPSAVTIYAGTPGEITPDTWHAVELRFKGGDATTGGGQFWLDNTLKGTINNLNTSSLQTSRLEIGGNSTGGGTAIPVNGSQLYIDDVKINNTSIGAFEPAGNANIYKTGSINWPVRAVYQDATLLNAKNALESMEAGSWYNDTVADILYVWTSESDNPADYTIEAARRNSGITLTSRNYIVIDGFTMQYHNNTSFGAIHLSSSHHNEFKNNLIQDNHGAGVLMNASDENTISNNEFLRNRRQFGGGVRFENGSDNNEIRNNTIIGTALRGGNGIFFCGDTSCNAGNNENILRGNTISEVYDSCIYLDTDNDGTVVEQNICHNSYRTTNSSGGNGIHVALGSDDTKIFNNLVHDVQRHGISVRDGNTSQGYRTNDNTYIANNTIYRVGYGGAGLGESGNGINIQGTNTNTKIFNNIVHTARSAAVAIDPGSIENTQSDYNAWYNTAGSGVVAQFNNTNYTSLSSYQNISTLDRHSNANNPQFVNIDDSSFNLQAASPAIDKGQTLTEITTDIQNISRPQGCAYDIGAYEKTGVNCNTNSGQTANSVISQSSGNPSLSGCPAAPTNMPVLFQIDRMRDRATLHFTPVNSSMSGYHIAYGPSEQELIYATAVPGTAQGVQQVDIFHLPLQAFTFRVRGVNGCADGPWSNTLGTGAGTSSLKKYYYFSPASVRVVSAIKTPRNIQQLQHEGLSVSPRPTATPQKKEPTLSPTPVPSVAPIHVSRPGLYEKIVSTLQSIFQW